MVDMKEELRNAISEVVSIAISSGVKGEEIAEILEDRLAAIKRANSAVLFIGDALAKATGKEDFTKQAQAVIVGESKGNA